MIRGRLIINFNPIGTSICANKVNEYHQLRSQMEALMGVMEPLQYIPGELNVSADMCTRGKADMMDMLPGGVWQAWARHFS